MSEALALMGEEHQLGGRRKAVSCAVGYVGFIQPFLRGSGEGHREGVRHTSHFTLHTSLTS